MFSTKTALLEAALTLCRCRSHYIVILEHKDGVDGDSYVHFQRP